MNISIERYYFYLFSYLLLSYPYCRGGEGQYILQEEICIAICVELQRLLNGEEALLEIIRTLIYMDVDIDVEVHEN